LLQLAQIYVRGITSVCVIVTNTFHYSEFVAIAYFQEPTVIRQLLYTVFTLTHYSSMERSRYDKMIPFNAQTVIT